MKHYGDDVAGLRAIEAELDRESIRFGELHRDAERRGELTLCLHPDERVRVIARLIREAKQ